MRPRTRGYDTPRFDRAMALAAADGLVVEDEDER
jgi:hypothetical protein